MSLSFKSIPLKDFLESHNKDYTDSKVFGLEEFKEKVAQYLESLDKYKGQNEKAIVANALVPFLKSLGFHAQAAFKQKGNSEIDLALLKDSQVEILIEAKTQKNKTEMFSAENPNCKALHECILYYLRERENNTRLKYILITDFYQFYLFRAKEFERYFYKNKKIQDAYKSLNKKDLLENQKDFYAELAKILSKEFQGNLEEDLSNTSLQGAHFDLRNDKHFKQSYAILNKEFLHDEFHRDSNALNPKFYYELLHILGLKEIETKGKILIQIDEAQKSSFAKHISDKLKNDHKPSDFETTMSHIIVWLNRILFLKLIEANLLHFNDFDKNLRFLTSTKITSFSILAHLFFEVLARDYAERKQDKGFNFLPYLNSSLFIRDEKEICDLSALDDALEILPFDSTQTEYKSGKPVRFLAYLFDFLECFDFGKSQDSNLSDKLINSSVLGAMFEKLNGYQEGSFYTPNFITSYMCKESLQKIVLEKFNAQNPQWNARTLEDIEDEIRQEKRNATESRTKIKEKYIKLLESIRICDPSVGSGHFLVSALSEMVSVYYRLGLLEIDCEDLRILDDEIYLTKGSKNFTYQRPEGEQDKNHQIQKELFELKKSIIENNLFGVDINPNSCNIARLRLWIELLKNAYYLNFSKDKDSKIHKLQTLPNIDINIKCGNSLISHFDTYEYDKQQNPQRGTFAWLKKQDSTFSKNFKEKLLRYNELVQIYKEKLGNKQDIDKEIHSLKTFFKDALINNGYIMESLEKNLRAFVRIYGDECFDMETPFGMEIIRIIRKKNLKFQPTLEELEPKPIDKKGQDLLALIHKEFETLESLRKSDTFEWRFAFPEVLDLETFEEKQKRVSANNAIKATESKENKQEIKDTFGDFLGFDLVIGNPPYIRQEEIKHLKPQLQKAFSIYKGTSDIYTYFYEQGYKILSPNGTLSFITSNKWCRAAYGEPLRKFLLENTTINTYLDLNGIKVFESATVDTSILEFYKAKASENHALNYDNPKDYNPKDEKPLLPQYSKISQNALSSESFIFSDSKLAALKAKIESIGTPLKDWDISINYGIKTGYNEAFIIDSTKRGEILKACKDENERARTKGLIKPILRGRDIKRYSYEWAGLWIILAKFDSHKYLEKDYPAIYNHLLQHKDKLQARGQCRYARGNKTDTGKGYSGQHHWLELDNNPKDSYLREFAKPKIVYSEIVREPQFYLDNGEFKFGYFYAEATSFILSGNKNFKSSLEYLLGLLHSKLCTFAFKEFYAGGGLGESGYRYKKAFLENLPIPKITQSQEAEFSKIVNAIIQCKKENPTTKDLLESLESKLDSMVFSLYGLDEKEINIIVRGGGAKYSLAYLLLACVESQLIVLVKLLCENFELELKETFKFCEGLKVPSIEKQAKISWQRVTQEPSFIIESGYYLLDSMAFLTHYSLEELHYLLGFLNSKAIFYYFKNIGHLYLDKGFLLSNQYVERFPIPKISNISKQTHKEIMECVGEILTNKKQDSTSDTKALESRLDSLIYKAYGLNENEINLIETELSTRERERTEIIENLYYLLESFVRDSNMQYQGKIIWAEMTNTPCFTYDAQGFYINQTCYFIPRDDTYLCAILNSKLIYFYMRQIASNLGDGAFRWIKQYIEKLPIPKITKSNQKIADRIIALVDDILESKAKDSATNTRNLESEIDSLVYQLYNLTDEETRIIETS